MTHITLPRFGVILSVKTSVDIKKDEEYFASYGYGIPGPSWYRDVYAKYAKENPSEEAKERLKEFDRAIKEHELADEEMFGKP